MIDFKKALELVQSRGMFHKIMRYQYIKDFNIEENLQLVEQIGKSRDPKFVIDRENRFTYANFIKWLRADTSIQAIHPDSKQVVPGNLKKGIYIAGSTGSGKSWCMEIMLAYAKLFGFRIDYSDIESNNDRIWWQIKRADEIVDAYVNTTSIENYRNQPILCIQDLGSESREAMSMGNRLEVMRTLLESRGDRSDVLTFITSNLSMSNPKLKEMYGDRVVSRLNEMCNYYEIKGKDRRKL